MFVSFMLRGLYLYEELELTILENDYIWKSCLTMSQCHIAIILEVLDHSCARAQPLRISGPGGI